MSKTRNMRNRKPDLLVLLTFFVGLGVLLTSFVQAAEPARPVAMMQHAEKQSSGHEQWFRSLWGFDLAGKLKNWKPKVAVAEYEDGFSLSRPFGTRGPVLQVSASVPEAADSGLHVGGNSQLGPASEPDAFIFLQKRW